MPALRAGVANLAADAKDVGESRAFGDGALAGALDDGAVGEWVAERDAKLDDVGAGVDGGDGHVAGGREVGVARGEVDDKAGFVREVQRHWSIPFACSASALHRKPTM